MHWKKLIEPAVALFRRFLNRDRYGLTAEQQAALDAYYAEEEARVDAAWASLSDEAPDDPEDTLSYDDPDDDGWAPQTEDEDDDDSGRYHPGPGCECGSCESARGRDLAVERAVRTGQGWEDL